jgi:hypothetical protein
MSIRMTSLVFSALALASLASSQAVAAQSSFRYSHHERLARTPGPNRFGVERFGRESLPGYLDGAINEPGAGNRYMSDTREGSPEYQQGSAFVTRGFDLLPDARPF